MASIRVTRGCRPFIGLYFEDMASASASFEKSALLPPGSPGGGEPVRHVNPTTPVQKFCAVTAVFCAGCVVGLAWRYVLPHQLWTMIDGACVSGTSSTGRRGAA